MSEPTEYQDSTQQPPVHDDDPPARNRPGLDGDDAVPRDMHAGDGNLLELPDGATFGTQEQPSDQERERLLRRAAQTEQEMQDSTERDSTERDGAEQNSAERDSTERDDPARR